MTVRRKDHLLCGYGRTDDRSINTYVQVVRAYRVDHASDSAWVVRYYRTLPSLKVAIEVAARALLPNGKRHPHQYRIRQATLRVVHRRLLNALPEIRATNRFEQLHALVDGLLSDVDGAGELLVYDTAHRIGAYLGCEPERVYLHSGTRTGARAIGLGDGRRVVEMSALPSELRQLKPHEVEDCLCIFKSELARIARKQR